MKCKIPADLSIFFPISSIYLLSAPPSPILLGPVPVEFPPLPTEAIRDLLGIARAYYRAVLHTAEPGTLKELEEVGKKLRFALELAGSPPDSLGRRAAWSHAEEATERLGRVVMGLRVEALVEAAVKRVVR